MVIELAADAAMLATDSFLLAGDASKGLLGSALAGAVLGATMPDQKSTIITSLGAGAVIPVMLGAKVTPVSLAISMATSTAIGLVVHKIKDRHYSHRETHPENHALTHSEKLQAEKQKNLLANSLAASGNTLINM